MAQILNMHIHTRPSDPILVASSTKHKANLSLLKKNSSVSYKSKRPNSHIASSLGQNEASVATKSRIIKPADITIERSMFPPDFKFGAGSAAYQVEGAWNEGGRGPSIWDTYTHQKPSKIEDGSSGDVATDSYHRYKDDVKMLKKLGVDTYRFSISWPRILPDGTVKGGVNREGIMYYNNLINELITNDIAPFVTLFHWDVPQALEDKYQGFLSEKIVDDFKDYCQVCFREFGDRVKHWTTLNEPWTFSCLGYSLGRHAPGRCTPGVKKNEFTVGDSLTEPYIVTHNLILAHGAAARLYKNHFQSIQGGEIGIVINSLWYEPYDSTKPKDIAAAKRGVEFMVGWYMDPLTKGEYPDIMRELVGERLPVFDEKQSEMIKGSFDFIGLNYYSSRFAKDDQSKPFISISDNMVYQTETDVNGKQIGEKEGSWIYVFPDGMKDLLKYAKKTYNNPKIYVTENGTAQLDPHQKLPVEKAISDMKRINYMKLHLLEISKAIEDDGVNVQGYYVWSLTDNFEWDKGYTERFGLHYINYENNLARIPKKSVEWYNQFLRS